MDDAAEIRTLLARYCFALDDRRLAELAALFAPDGTWAASYGSATGPAAIEALLQRVVPDPASGFVQRHMNTNIVVTLEAAGDGAQARSYYMVVRSGPTGPMIAVVGTYVDRLVRRNGTWLFQARTLQHDIAGGPLPGQ